MADKDETSSCSDETLSRTTSCSSISYNPPISISDSSDEEWKQVDSRLKRRLKKKLVQNSTDYSFVSSCNEPENQVSISHEPGAPDKASVTLRAQSTSDSVPVVSFHFYKLDLLCIDIACIMDG